MKLTRISGLFATALLMASCHSNKFKIEGVAEGFLEGDTLYVVNGSGEFTDTMVVHDNKFELSGNVDSVALFVISSQTSYMTVPFFKEPGTINIVYSAEGESKVSGTIANDAFQKFQDMGVEYTKKEEAMFKDVNLEELTEEEQKAFFEKYQQIQSDMQTKIVEFAENNIRNEFGYFLVCNIPIGESGLSGDKALELMDKMPKEYQARLQITKLKAEIESMRDFEVGKPIRDFNLPTPEGNEMSVLEEVKKHKITILDFWASWCGPCRQEMPNLVALYKNYSEKGLGIIGISLDESKDDWAEAIKKMNMNWPQVSDLKGWQSEPATVFQVRAIPYTILVDSTGTIIAKELRGSNLEDFISSNL